MQDKPPLLSVAKHVRHVPTDAKIRLWRHLRAGRMGAYNFKRQQPMGCFIVDFVCFQSRLIVEIDGGQHVGLRVADEVRTAWLQSQGFRVIRFWNHDVLQRSEFVLEEILRVLEQ